MTRARQTLFLEMSKSTHRWLIQWLVKNFKKVFSSFSIRVINLEHVSKRFVNLSRLVTMSYRPSQTLTRPADGNKYSGINLSMSREPTRTSWSSDGCYDPNSRSWPSLVPNQWTTKPNFGFGRTKYSSLVHQSEKSRWNLSHFEHVLGGSWSKMSHRRSLVPRSRYWSYSTCTTTWYGTMWWLCQLDFTTNQIEYDSTDIFPDKQVHKFLPS